MSVMCIKDIIGRAHLWIRRLSPNVLDEPNNGQPQEVNHTSGNVNCRLDGLMVHTPHYDMHSHGMHRIEKYNTHAPFQQQL